MPFSFDTAAGLMETAARKIVLMRKTNSNENRTVEQKYIYTSITCNELHKVTHRERMEKRVSSSVIKKILRI